MYQPAREWGPDSAFNHFVQVSILTSGSSVPSLRRPRSSTKMWELGFSAGTVNPSPDKKKWKELSLPLSLSVSVQAGWFGHECLRCTAS